MKPLNFNNVAKKYLSVTLADEKGTTLMIGTPTKAIMDDLFALRTAMNEVAEDDADSSVVNELYSACARVMSRNKAGVKISTDYLAEIFDFEDIMIFFDAYMNFISEVTGEKN